MAYYFNNDAVTELIVEYLSYPLEERTEVERPLVLRQQILKEVCKIINGIIFKHKFTIWEQYDDLFQEASMACIKALDKFDPNFVTVKGKKTTAFSYFSLTAKRCLKFYTIRNKKNRNHQPIEDHEFQLKSKDNFIELNSKTAIDNVISQLREIFSTKKYKKFNKLIDILEEYLQKIGVFNKRDFFRFGKSYGWSPNLIRKFLKIIKENKDKFDEYITNYEEC